MAVRIRLRRMGRKKQPHYRVVVADGESPRDGRFVENLGYYHPLQQPARLVIDLERVDYWLGQGASPSDTVQNLIDKARKGGDDSLVFGVEDTEARQKEETEALQARRRSEKAEAKSAEARSGEAKGAEAEVGRDHEVPEDVAEKPSGSSAKDSSVAEAQAQPEEEAVAQAEDQEPNAPPEEGIAEASAAEGSEAASGQPTGAGEAQVKTQDANPTGTHDQEGADAEEEGDDTSPQAGADAEVAVEGPSEDEAPEVPADPKKQAEEEK